MNLIEVVTVTLEPKKEEPKFPKAFAIEIDDVLGLYKLSLLNRIKKATSKFDKNIANKINYGDYLVFSEKGVELEKDFRNLLFKGTPVIKLVKDFEKAYDTVENFFTNVYKPKTSPCDNCPLAAVCKAALGMIEKQEPIKVYDGEFISVEEKVQIFTNYVKVGYDTYPLFMYKNKVVFKTEDAVFEVKRDGIFGKQYIQELV